MATDSDIDLAIKTARRLESLLEKRYGASGRGLHEKLDKVGHVLPEEAIGAGRYVAVMRNKLAHEEDAVLADRERFNRSAEMLENAILRASGKKSRTRPSRPIPKGVWVTGAALALFLFYAFAILPPGPVQSWRDLLVLAALLVGIALPSLLWVRRELRRGRVRLRQPVLLGLLLTLGFLPFLYVAVELWRRYRPARA